MNHGACLFLLSVLLLGCEQISPFISEKLFQARFDRDGDGIPRPNDCNDNDKKIQFFVWFRDVDQDGFGAGEKIIACKKPVGTSVLNTDCDDTKKEIYPNAKELCNNADDNCNGQTDENATRGLFFDHDEDGFGGTKNIPGCLLPTNATSSNTDCDDLNKTVYPNANEICDNKIDENCNGITDDAPSATAWFEDADKDGFGNPNVSLSSCVTPAEFVLNANDCDDTLFAIHPGAIEICANSADDDCNGQTDTDANVVTWYEDADKDGFGNPNSFVKKCAPPEGFVENANDCVDTNKSIHPNAKEICNNGVDDNCDKSVNECVLKGTIQINDVETIQIHGPENQNFAASITVCDINQDSWMDLVVGSPASNANQGKISIYLGPLTSNQTPNTEITGLINGQFGASLACSTTGTKPLLLVGSPGDPTGGNSAGAVYLFKTNILKSKTITDANAVWTGTKQNMHVGSTCMVIPDQDNNNQEDFFVGANGYGIENGSWAGAGFLLSSSFEGKTVIQNAFASLINKTNDELAGSALAAGFLNSDNQLDFVLGAISSDTTGPDAGTAYIQMGPLSGQFTTKSSIAINGISPFDTCGQSLSAQVDLTGDSLHDLLIGSPGDGNQQDIPGSIILAEWKINGKDLNPNLFTFTSKFGGDLLGYSVTSGFIDQDKTGDILVSAPKADDAGQNTGTVFIKYGPITKGGDIRQTADAMIQGNFIGGQLGWLVQIIPDVHSDGVNDLLFVTKSTKPERIIYVFPGLGL